MSTEKEFSHAGVSRLEGVLKVRYANSEARVKVLEHYGHTEIKLTELLHPMTKKDAVACLVNANFDEGNAEIRKCLIDEATKRGVKIEGIVPDPKQIAEIERMVKEKADKKEADRKIKADEREAARAKKLEAKEKEKATKKAA